MIFDYDSIDIDSIDQIFHTIFIKIDKSFSSMLRTLYLRYTFSNLYSDSR